MDLKSMLNDSSVQRQPPRLHTPQSSFDRGAENTPGNDSASDRYHHYHSQSRSADSRSPQSAGFFVAHSPRQQHSASTPGTTGPPIYAQSPGGHGQPYTPRESVPPQTPYNVNHIPSPSPHPHTPIASGYFPSTSHTTIYPQPSGPHRPVQRQATREEEHIQNGAHSQRQPYASPSGQLHAPPVTPLGPPVSHPRPSPHSQRPTSQGHDSYRTSSYGSVGSNQSKEYSAYHLAQSRPGRGASAQRTHPGEEERLKRERSVESVSPKTVPRPPPPQQKSHSQEPHAESRLHMQTQSSTTSAQPSPHRHLEGHNQTHPPKGSAPSSEPRGTSQYSSSRPSPAPAGTDSLTPQSTHSSLPAEPSPQVSKQPSLKRNASVISTITASTMPPRKRLKREEIPIFAQDARRGRPLRLDTKRPTARPLRNDNNNVVKRGVEDKPVSNGHAPSQEAPLQSGSGWEPSILNIVPYEDLTRQICDWIVSTIGQATPPAEGAMFEIEAKIGAIVEIDDGVRLRLPVTTETVFARDQWKRTKFESTMDMAQHQQLNAFLNSIVQKSFVEAQNSNREIVHHSHLKEADEFFELTPEGRRHLPQSIAHWLNPRHKPRVRRTIDSTTGQMKAQIIKSRIADLEVFNPHCDFDYRISISIESPWEGEVHHLTEMTDGGRDRRKDRMSYRHLAYQIDLTQVSYASNNKLEHELEVEISTEQIRKELDNLRNQRASRYEDLVRGFIDNVRILCRKGTVVK